MIHQPQSRLRRLDDQVIARVASAMHDHLRQTIHQHRSPHPRSEWTVSTTVTSAFAPTTPDAAAAQVHSVPPYKNERYGSAFPTHPIYPYQQPIRKQGRIQIRKRMIPPFAVLEITRQSRVPQASATRMAVHTGRQRTPGDLTIPNPVHQHHPVRIQAPGSLPPPAALTATRPTSRLLSTVIFFFQKPTEIRILPIFMLDRRKTEQPELLKCRLPGPAQIGALPIRYTGSHPLIISIDDLSEKRHRGLFLNRTHFFSLKFVVRNPSVTSGVLDRSYIFPALFLQPVISLLLQLQRQFLWYRT